MPRAIGFLWGVNTIVPRMLGFNEVVESAVDVNLMRLADEMRDYMQSNAPWEDRTGMAREGLDTQVDVTGWEHSITLFHSVDYGVWLEIRWSGQYAIIIPTIEHFGGEVLGGIQFGGGL